MGQVFVRHRTGSCKFPQATSDTFDHPWRITKALQPIYLFDLAAKQAHWLSLNQATIASNVANANTPAYKAQAVQPFADVLDRTQLQLTATNPAHLDLDPAAEQAAAVSDQDPWETTESGNTVSLEQEMMKAGDVNRSFSLNTSVLKAFHGMLMSSLKA